MNRLTETQAAMVWGVLVAVCGARPSLWDQFVHYVTREDRYGHEFRFEGNLGPGGKFYRTNGSWTVSCYLEDHTNQRSRTIDEANKYLDAIRLQAWFTL